MISELWDGVVCFLVPRYPTRIDLPLNAVASLEGLVLHPQVRGVEICRRVERFDGQDDVVEGFDFDSRRRG
jgi:hypothetical protein